MTNNSGYISLIYEEIHPSIIVFPMQKTGVLEPTDGRGTRLTSQFITRLTQTITHIYRKIRITKSSNLHVFGLREDAGVPGGEHTNSTQKKPKSIWGITLCNFPMFQTSSRGSNYHEAMMTLRDSSTSPAVSLCWGSNTSSFRIRHTVFSDTRPSLRGGGGKTRRHSFIFPHIAKTVISEKINSSKCVLSISCVREAKISQKSI